MAAPKQNQFWKKRSTHGRKRIFANADIMWLAAQEYFKWCDENPWYKTEQLKNPGKPFMNEKGKYIVADSVVHLPNARPYTLNGLCIFLDVNTHYFIHFKDSIENKKGKKYQDFSTVITRIEEIIRTQKYEGAAVGAFNANIIARDLGLIDKIDHTSNGKTMASSLILGLPTDKLQQLEQILSDANAASKD